MKVLNLISVIILSFQACANVFSQEVNPLLGTWKTGNSSLEFIDGFNPKSGPVILVNKKGIRLGTWFVKKEKLQITTGYFTENIEILEDSILKYSGDKYNRAGDYVEENIIKLKDNKASFIQDLTSIKWKNPSNNDRVLFKTTFSNDSGVQETYGIKDEVDLGNWSVSKEILKIGSRLLIESRISSKYLIGVDSRDNFYLMQEDGKPTAVVKRSLKEQRDAFFDDLLSGSWIGRGWDGDTVHKFRPITDELKGTCFGLLKGKLVSERSWEYSPASGGLELGHSKYNGAMTLGNTLVLLDGKKQSFYSRNKNEEIKRYRKADVTVIDLNENSLTKIEKSLSGQFKRGENFVLFEFNGDKRTGFSHIFRSKPFIIEGATMKGGVSPDAEHLYLVEDFVLFDDREVLQRDASISRMKPKTDKEAEEDTKKDKEIINSSRKKNLLLRVSLSNGKSVEIPIPASTFGEILKMEVLSE